MLYIHQYEKKPDYVKLVEDLLWLPRYVWHVDLGVIDDDGYYRRQALVHPITDCKVETVHTTKVIPRCVGQVGSSAS